MQIPLRPISRESTEEMVRNICREPAEIEEQAAIRRLDPAQNQGERKVNTPPLESVSVMSSTMKYSWRHQNHWPKARWICCWR